MSGISLEKQWLEAIPESEGYPISPTGFKQLIQSTLDFLQLHELATTMWVKLPKKEIWRTDFERYAHRRKDVTIYSLERGDPLPTSFSEWQPIPLDLDDDLKQEYLFLVLAEGFACTFLAVRHPQPAELSPTTSRSQLTLYCSLSNTVPRALATALQQFVQAAKLSTVTRGSAAHGTVLDNTVTSSTASRALSHWRLVQHPPSPALVDAFLTWQMQAHAQCYSQICYQSSLSALAHERAVAQGDFLKQSWQELRMPLTTVKTALTLLNSDHLETVQRQRYLDLITQAYERQSSLINGVFELLQLPLSSPQLQSIRLVDIVPSVVSMYQPLAQERSVLLDYVVPADLPTIAGVEASVRQVLIQLLQNAIHYTDHGGQVQVTAHRESEQFVALRVEDTGSGISRTDLAQVFDSFYRGVESTGKVGGAGLGLTLVQRLLEQCGGSVSVESTLNQGSIFTVLLPIYNKS
ncbi:MAG: ATP-binding protein [Cyanobacteria bacterium J06626_23]